MARIIARAAAAVARRHGPALACLALLTAAYAWPLLAQLRTAFPGTAHDLDVVTLIWNLSWFRHAALTGHGWLYSDAVLVPFGADLRLHAYAPLHGLAGLLLAPLAGLLGAFNLVVIGTVFLNGAAAYLLVYRQVRDRTAGLLASGWFMLGLPLLAQIAAGRPSFASLWLVAAALLALQALLDRPRLAYAIVLGLVVLAALGTDLQMALFAALWLGLYGTYRLARDRRALLGERRPLYVALAALIAVVPFILVYYPALTSSRGYRLPLPVSMLSYSFRWWDYVTPATIPYTYGYEYLLAVVAVLPVQQRRGAWRFWLVSGVVFLLLALGPYLQPGQTELPYMWLTQWSPLRQFRTPARLAMPALLGLTVVAGYALAAWLPRLRSRPVLWALVALALVAKLLQAKALTPLNAQTYPEYSFYTRIALEPGDFTVLEVPFGVRSGLERIGQGGEALLYYQTVHGKPVINAMIARLPATVFRFYRSHPALLLLAGDTPKATPAALDADFADVLAWSRARYVVVHRALLPADRAAAIEAFVDRQPQLRRVAAEGDLLAYRRREAAGCARPLPL